MILLAVLWIPLLALSWWIGSSVLSRVDVEGAFTGEDRDLAAAWIGLLLLAVGLLGAASVAPLTPAVGLLTSAALAAAAAAFRRGATARFGATLQELTVAAALLLSTAWLASKQVTWYDTGLYHFGIIRWLAAAGSTPGLALVQPSFGFTSAWLALPAPLESGVLAGRVSAVANGLAALLAALHLTIAAARAADRRAAPSDRLALVASVVLLPTVLWMAASATPDLPVLLLSLLVAWAMLLTARSRGDVLNPRLVPLLLAALGTAVKLSSLPLLAVAGLFYLAGCHRVGRGFAAAASIAAATLLPGVAYALITSGCPLFPSPALCLDLPWTVDRERLPALATLIRDWARWDGLPPAGATATGWISGWVFRHPATALLVVADLALLGWAVGSRRILAIPGGGWAAAVAVAGGVFVMATAPAPRFVLGYAAIVPGLALAALTGWARARGARVGGRRGSRSFVLAGSAVTAAILLASAALIRGSETIRGEVSLRQLVAPPSLPVPARLDARNSNGIDYRVPVGDDRCWAAQLPCTPYEIPPDVVLRRPASGIAGGFTRR